MFLIDPLLIYILVPAVLVSVLILIRLRQERTDRAMAKVPTMEPEEQPMERVKVAEIPVKASKEAKTKPKFSEEKGSKECPHYLGYLYMKRSPDSTYIPNECYGCRKLLECLYSPNVIEKVYGQ